MNSRPTAGIQSCPPDQVIRERGRRPAKLPRLNSQPSSSLIQLQEDAVLDLASEADKSWTTGIEKVAEWKTGTPQSEIHERDGVVEGQQTRPGTTAQDIRSPEFSQGAKNSTSPSNSGQSCDAPLNPLLAFPPRPGTTRLDDTGLDGQQKPSPSTPQTAILEPPACATMLPGDNFWHAGADGAKTRRGECKVADFFSWQACNPEDTLTEQNVKSGFCDKSQNVQHETNTARPSVWTHLKNKQGLQVLSSLLVNVLEKRQHVGYITSGSTFKPPPRITMTDTRRETWLRDLANPDVPVRRQSKHVPHGIKGKALLEQCLNKSIPISRAVWLVKCIGANEIRGLKRRGGGGSFAMGGELKWVREWTAFVQQFVESLIGLCGQQDWQLKMQYGTRLVTQIFEERLLDREQYLDWLLCCIETTKRYQLPVWMLLVQIYWKSLVSNRQRGKRLAEALLAHLSSILSEDVDTIFQTLTDRLRALITTLAIYHRGCLILPASWGKYKHLLQAPTEQSSDQNLVSAYTNIQNRNERLICTHFASKDIMSSPTKSLITLLDAFDHRAQFGELSAHCLRSFSDKRQLVATVLLWASSNYRIGDYRIYLVVRLLRNWQITNFDVQDGVLSFLRSSAFSRTVCSVNIFRILAELVRSGHFSMGRYLQWLISEGCLAEDNECKAFHIRLLTELPWQRLPKHIINLRHLLLQQARCNLSQELYDTDRGLLALAQRVPNLFPQKTPSSIMIPVEQLNISNKLELCRHLRQCIQRHTKPDDLVKLKAKSESSEDPNQISAISNEDFCASRQLLEDCRDFAMLADVLDLAITSNDETVLASVTDTVHYHAQTFAAIGALRPLSKTIVERYCSLRIQRLTSRSFLLTLRDSVSIFQVDPRIPSLIERDLVRCDRKTAGAMCSPVSDTNEATQSSKLDSNEEIERILSSGTTMDELTMSRLFQKISIRMEQHIESKSRSAEAASFSCWLYWLRSFDEKKFEVLIQDWLIKLLEEGHTRRLHQALCSLAGAGCLPLKSLVSSIASLHSTVKSHPHSKFLELHGEGTCLSALKMLLPLDASLLPHFHAPDAYRLRVCQQVYCQNRPRILLDLLCRAIKTANAAVSEELLDDWVLGYVVGCLVNEPSVVLEAFEMSSGNISIQALSNFKRLADKMIETGGEADFAKLSLERQVATLIEIADDLSRPFCVFALHQLSRLFEVEPSSFGERKATSIDAFSNALKAAVGAGASTWPHLLEVIPLEITRKVREQAEDSILSLSNFAADNNDTNVENNRRMLERYLTLIAATAHIPVSSERAYFADAITNRLGTLSEIVVRSEEYSSFSTSFIHMVSLVRPWLDAIIHLANVNKALFFDIPSTTEAQKRIVDILCALLREPRLQACPDLIEYTFDLVASFSDHMTSEIRSHFSIIYASSPSSDSRLSFLFGSSVPPDAWLALTHPSVTPTPPPSATAGSMPPPPQNTPTRFHSAPQGQSSMTKNHECRTAPFVLNRWELLQAPPPLGENDTSLSLSLFGARHK